MKTVVINIEDENDPLIRDAAQILMEGGTVVFPTETVYGLGANALSEAAVRRIYHAKGRPSDNPLIVHIADWSQIYELVSNVSDQAEELSRVFLPGPLTMILPKRSIVPNVVTGNLDTVAVRIPSHPVARALITQAGVPVAAPSANLSGKPSPTRAEHALADMSGRVDCMLCGGDALVGVESTVLDMTTSPPVILRPGGITVEQLAEVLPNVVLDPSLENVKQGMIPRAPGMKYKHYAPEALMQVYTGMTDKVIKTIQLKAIQAIAERKRVAVIGHLEHKEWFEAQRILFLSLGAEDTPHEAANQLFNCLRICDDAKVDIILAQAVPETGIGRAVMNRMRKASGNNIVNLDSV